MYKINYTFRRSDAMRFDGTLEEARSQAKQFQTIWNDQGQDGFIGVVHGDYDPCKPQTYRFSISHSGLGRHGDDGTYVSATTNL